MLNRGTIKGILIYWVLWSVYNTYQVIHSGPLDRQVRIVVQIIVALLFLYHLKKYRNYGKDREGL